MMADEDEDPRADAPPETGELKSAEKPPETDDARSARHRAELGTLVGDHKARVAQAHKDYPTPAGVKFTRLGPVDKKKFNRRRAVIDASNRAYHRAVRAACERHRGESANTPSVVARGLSAARVLAEHRRAMEAVR